MSGSRAQRPRWRQWTGRVAAGVLVLAVLGAAGLGYLWWRSLDGYERTTNAYVRGDVTVVSPRVEGYVAEVLVEDHQHVMPGTPLVRLVDDRLRADVARQRAEVARRAAALDNHRARLDAQRSLIEVADARVKTAAATVARVENDLSRSARLVRRGWTTQQVHEDNLARLDIARAELEEVRSEAAAERRRLDVLESEAGAIRAELENARAALRLAEIALEDAVVGAPVAGIVGNRNVQPGEYVRAGTQLLSLVPTEKLWIEANFKETQIGAMRSGQPARFTVDAFGEEVFCGAVETLSPASGAEFALIPPDNATGNFTKVVRRIPVRIQLPDAHPRRSELRVGMSVVVTVRSDRVAGDNPHPSLAKRILAALGLAPESRCFE